MPSVTLVTCPTLKSLTFPALTVPPNDPVLRGQKNGRKPTSSFAGDDQQRRPAHPAQQLAPRHRIERRVDGGRRGGSHSGAPTGLRAAPGGCPATRVPALRQGPQAPSASHHAGQARPTLQGQRQRGGDECRCREQISMVHGTPLPETGPASEPCPIEPRAPRGLPPRAGAPLSPFVEAYPTANTGACPARGIPFLRS